MASVSGATSSLGNTSLRGFGGLASGIDRDEMIEAMTSGTQSKIDSQKSAMTKMQWKQEAYRSVIDKIVDIEDSYLSYTSGTNLKSYDLFARNVIDMIGDSDITKFVKASGTSDWVDNLSIQAVENLATAATRRSKAQESSAIQTGITDLDEKVTVSRLAGRKLVIGTEGYKDKELTFNSAATFTFPTSYSKKLDTGETITKEIDYTDDPSKWINDLNEAAKECKIGDKGHLAFKYENDKIQIMVVDADNKEISNDPPYKVSKNSSALSALGFNTDELEKDEKNKVAFDLNAAEVGFSKSCVDSTKTMKQYLTGQKLTISYGGQTKSIDLIKDQEEADKLSSPDTFKDLLQKNIDKAFGSGKIKVEYDKTKGLLFNAVTKNGEEAQTLTVNVDSAEMRKIIGIEKNASNKLSLDSSLWDNREKFNFGNYNNNDAGKAQFQKDLQNFTINGTKIEGITADTTVNELMKLINSNKEVGVKASYLSGSGQLLLVATETGAGRQITFGDETIDADGNVVVGSGGAAAAIFGGGDIQDGQDAKILVSYGNGVSQTLTSSTNTFNLEGLKVTVSGEFGYKKDADGNYIYKKDADGNNTTEKVLDTSQSVSFSAKADAEKATETVKKFFEAFNAMVEEVNNHVITRSDSAYAPLTDAQKEEMDEKSIENWENKAKQGILFGDSTMTEFSTALQNVMVNLMRSGISYSDLEEIGITMSDDEKDGGKIIFDETKFKTAMENDPDLVSDIFTGGGDVQKGLAYVIEDTLTPYATRYRSDNAASPSDPGSYGRLVEEAGSEKMPLSISKNYIYTQLQEMEKTIETLKSRLKTEQDRYIKQFTTMESMINKYNTQAGYLSQFQG